MLNRPLLWCVVLFGLFPSSAFSQITADFNANITNGCGSLQASFTDLSTSSAGAIVSWSWDLGGVNSTNQNPGRIFGTPGQYTICLTVTDVLGATATECKTDFITVHDLPQPDFSVSFTDGCIPSTITFTDLSTSNGANIVEWVWGVGGEKGVVVDNGALPTFDNTYDLADAYTISLTIRDENNCINTITRENFITIHPDPIIEFSADQTFGCSAPFVTNFTNESPDLSISYEWIFSNGATFNGANPLPITFDETGLYDVTLIAVDNQTGCTDTLFRPEYIQVGYPVDFGYTPESGCEDLLVSFEDLSTDAASQVSWNFGDGNTSTDANPTHVYDMPGCYTVVLTRIVDGCPSTAVSENCINVFEEPVGLMANDHPKGCALPHVVNFTSNSIDAITWEWNFGDGNSSTEANPTYSYETAGLFPVSLTITNANGCSTTITTDTIEVVPLNARFIDNEEKGCTPLTFTLEENAQTVAPITNWEWFVVSNASSPPIEFTSTDQFPTFTLVDTGFYDLTLIVTNAVGCVDTSVFEKAVAVGMVPQVDFSADPLVSCINTAVFFTDASSSYTNAWYWEFGDFGISEEQNPFYEYSDTGKFDVKLTALHHGCPSEITIEQYIEITPPKAGFIVERDCENPYNIQLLDNSIGADSMFYDFGVLNVETDTTSSREPSFTFPNTGSYTISQYVYNFTTGCADTLYSPIEITEPDALFNLSETQGCRPLILTVENISEFALEYQWSGTGATFSDIGIAQPEITYSGSGAYTDLKLLITDINGCRDSLIFTDTIKVNDINVVFDAGPIEGCMPLTTQFTDSSSSFFGNPTEWRWDFGDGTGDFTEQNLSHTYDTSGYFGVKLRVTDDWGCSRQILLDSLIEVTNPAANFVAEDTLGCSSFAISFNSLSTGKGLSYQWSFGDGGTSTAKDPTYTYPMEGVYTVCLEVSDVYGCDSTFCREDYVVIADPVAAFTQDETFGTCPPLLVNFGNQSQNATTYEWNFGDESGSSTQENPPHLYTIPGIYDVSLIAVATENCKDTLIVEQLIHLDGPVGDFTFDIDTSCAPAVITFIGESIEPYDFIWDFGNGTLDTTLHVMNDTMRYNYIEDGSYVPKLILVDAVNCHRTVQSPDTIVIASMNIDFIADRNILCDNNANVSFSNLSSSSHPIQSAIWSFDGGDPNTSTALEPNVAFNNEGTYSIQLILDNGICYDSLTMDDYIRIGAVPEVNFAMSDTVGCTPFTVAFTDLSTAQNAIITEWEWDFGDQTSANLEQPVHIFDEVGTYDVQLIATSNIGCQDSMTLTLTTQPIPIVDLGESPTICMGEYTQLKADIGIDTVGMSYYWLPSPELTCTDCLDPLVNPMDTTIYTFVVTSAEGCSISEQIQVNVKPFPAPVIDLTSDTMICADGLIQLQVSGGDDLFSYQWENERAGLSCYEACINPIATPDETTTYVVSVTNSFGCFSQDSVTVGIVDQSQTFAGEDRAICEGDTVQLQTSIGNSPRWIVIDGLDCVYCPDPVASPEETTNYLVQVTTDDGCEIFDSVRVEVFKTEDVTAGDPTTICVGETVSLSGVGEGQITWSPVQSLDDPTVLAPAARPQLTTTYVMSIDNGACVITDSVTIEVQQKTEIFTEEVSICPGDSVELVVVGDADQYSWSPLPSLSETEVANPLAFPLETTAFQVIASLSSCEADTAIALVEVLPSPDIQMNNRVDFIPGRAIQLNSEIIDSSSYEYLWTPADGLSCTDCPNPTTTPDSSGIYTLEVTNSETGCSTEEPVLLSKLTTCPLNILSVPNIFSPNGDGINDRLEMFPTHAIDEIISFRIYDRWGALLYETTNITDSWDGTFNGRKEPSGVYVFMVEMTCELDGSVLVKAGDVTLVR